MFVLLLCAETINNLDQAQVQDTSNRVRQDGQMLASKSAAFENDPKCQVADFDDLLSKLEYLKRQVTETADSYEALINRTPYDALSLLPY